MKTYSLDIPKTKGIQIGDLVEYRGKYHKLVNTDISECKKCSLHFVCPNNYEDWPCQSAERSIFIAKP